MLKTIGKAWRPALRIVCKPGASDYLTHRSISIKMVALFYDPNYVHQTAISNWIQL